MGRTEADEIAELKSMFSAQPKGTIPINRRPAWDSTPLRHRPPALVGLKPVTREPWAIDEDVYNRRFETRDVGVRACACNELHPPHSPSISLLFALVACVCVQPIVTSTRQRAAGKWARS